MIENPFLTPPQVESPQSRSWGFGFAFGFQGPAFSSMTPTDIQPEDPDAFQQGVLAGQDAAANGLKLDSTCVDLNAKGPTLEHFAVEAPEGVAWLKELGGALAGGSVAGLVAGSVLLAITLSIAAETFRDDPEQRLAQAASALQDELQRMGFDQSMKLFIGGGVDTTVTGCEVQLTAIHRDQDSAVAEATGMGRPHWVVMSWRTDQSGGATVVANSPDS
jgi:hypothetical protein